MSRALVLADRLAGFFSSGTVNVEQESKLVLTLLVDILLRMLTFWLGLDVRAEAGDAPLVNVILELGRVFSDAVEDVEPADGE